MSGGGCRRSSKWDSREELQYEADDVQDRSWPGKGGMFLADKESQPGLISPENVGRNTSKWSDFEAHDVTKSNHDWGYPSRESLPRSRGQHKDDAIRKGYSRKLDSNMAWDDDMSYSARMSPGLDGWRRQNPSQSGSNGWKRSMRSRSRSRSRSQSRSRSPAHGFKRESSFHDRSRTRSGGSTQLCRDFASGKCRRGDDCNFLHQDNHTYNDSWEERHRKGGASRFPTRDLGDYPSRSSRSAACIEFMKGRCRRGADCKYPHDSAYNEIRSGYGDENFRERENDRRNRDASFDYSGERQHRKSTDVACKFFAAGNCRNGNQCQYSHHSQKYASPERKSRDDSREIVHGSEDIERTWDGSKWSDMSTVSDTNLKEVKNENLGYQEPRSITRSMDKKWSHSLHSDNETHVGEVADHRTAQTTEKEAILCKVEGGGIGISESLAPKKWSGNMEMSPVWNYSSDHMVKEEYDRIRQGSKSLRDVPLASHKPEISEGATVWRHDTGSHLQPIVVEKSNIQPSHTLMQDGTNVSSYNDRGLTEKNSVLQENSNFSANSVHGQNMAAIPNEHARGGMVNNPLVLPESTTDGNSSLISKKEDASLSTNENTVTSEQLSQLNNLSASLAQYLGNNQPLPQLYATLNPHSVVGAPSFSNFQAPVAMKPGEPDLSNKPPGILPNPTGHENTTDEKLQRPMKSLLPAFPASVTHHESNLANHPEAVAQYLVTMERNGAEHKDEKSKKMVEEKKSREESGPLVNVDGDGDDNKKSKDAKDTKGLRAFKFALVEFVKEVLKSAWKEGKINKDVYKIIVKKAVDKVTGTMQAGNIPQTQEKIDQYLASSKPKLTKLVQAYVEKAVKG